MVCTHTYKCQDATQLPDPGLAWSFIHLEYSSLTASSIHTREEWLSLNQSLVEETDGDDEDLAEMPVKGSRTQCWGHDGG